MRTRLVTQREGELLGPVDWAYDFAGHDWDHGGSTNPAVVAESLDRLRTLVDGRDRGETWEATTDGGWPRFGWGQVTAIGMYDGWPYWRPTPSVCIAGRYGGEWASFLLVSSVCVVVA